MRSLTRLLTAAVLTASAAVAMAQDLPQTSVTASKSRAEVMADLEMYQRAGLGYMPTPAAYVETEFSTEYRKAMPNTSVCWPALPTRLPWPSTSRSWAASNRVLS